MMKIGQSTLSPTFFLCFEIKNKTTIIGALFQVIYIKEKILDYSKYSTLTYFHIINRSKISRKLRNDSFCQETEKP